jgi:hypothetical protein
LNSSRSAGLGLSGSERAAAKEAKRKGKLLKTNDLAKRRDFAGNDSNDLRPGMRNRLFRHAKDSFRFRGFWASSRPEAQSPSTIPIPAPPARDRRRFEKLDRKKLRKGAAKALESLARVNLCAGPLYAPVCPADGDFRPRLGPSEAVARRSIAGLVHSFVVWRIRPDHGRILAICLKATGLRAGPRSGAADRPRRSPIGVGSSQFLAEDVDKLGRIDCGRFGAKSSDNYATWSGKRCLKPSL